MVICHMPVWARPYAICPYDMLICPYGYIVFGEPDPAKFHFNAFMPYYTILYYTIHLGICHMPVLAGPYAICPYGHEPI